MIHIEVNGFRFGAPRGSSILDVCKNLGLTVPRFCYHEMLSVSGNCRMCLVEVENTEKPVASCITEIEQGMVVFVNSPFVKKARENVLETLLLNHPLDCPICDQAGECDLQDQAKTFGTAYAKYFFKKRSVEDKDCGPLIKTIMTRCIHCTRCVRFATEIAGIDTLGTFGRGTSTEIGTYVTKKIDSEISGTIIDLCPVGALTAKPYAFKGRPWELKITDTIDVLDSLCSTISIHHRKSQVLRVLPRISSINDGIISDKARFSLDSHGSNRIKALYQKTNNKYYEETHRNRPLPKLSDKVPTNKRERNALLFQRELPWKRFYNAFACNPLIHSGAREVVIVITPETDYTTACFYKKLSHQFSEDYNVQVLNLHQKTVKRNLYIQNDNSSVSSIKEDGGNFCYVLSANPKVECTVLNAKLRRKYLYSTMSVYCSGQSFKSNMPTTFVNLSLKSTLDVFDCVKKSVSSSVVEEYKSIFVISENFSTRIDNLSNIITFLKEKTISCQLFLLSRFSNAEGINYLNIDSINKKETLDAANVFCSNLDDTLMTRKFLSKKKDVSFWMNSHGSKYASKCHFVLPASSTLETQGLYINLEQRPQNSKAVLSPSFNSVDPKNIIDTIFVKSEKFNKGKPNMTKEILIEDEASSYIYEAAAKETLYDYFYKNLVHEIFNTLFKGEQISCSKYPFKAMLFDFYLSSKELKNSSTMQICSKDMFIKTNFN
jgi:NADH-quinone oxidoreductase subunit G